MALMSNITAQQNMRDVLTGLARDYDKLEATYSRYDGAKAYSEFPALGTLPSLSPDELPHWGICFGVVTLSASIPSGIHT